MGQPTTDRLFDMGEIKTHSRPLPPPPAQPADIQYRNFTRIMSFRQVKNILLTKTLSGDLLRIEIAKRNLIRAIGLSFVGRALAKYLR